jgi:hypothetical protein
MKKLLLTLMLVTATLAVSARRSPTEILNDLYPHHNHIRTAEEIIDDVRNTLHPLQAQDCYSCYSTEEILDKLQKQCGEVTHFGPAYSDAVKKEKELRKKCKHVLRNILINPFRAKMYNFSKKDRIKNEILLEELEDLQKEMLAPFDDVIEILEKK